MHCHKHFISCRFATRGPFPESPNNVSGPKCCCLHSRSTFNNFENDTMKLSVNEPKLTSLWAWNCATIQQVLMSKFAFWPKKLPAFRETGSTGLKADSLENDMWTLQPFEEGWLFKLFRKETKNALLNTTVQLNTVSDLPWAKVCRFQTFLLLRLREEE